MVELDGKVAQDAQALGVGVGAGRPVDAPPQRRAGVVERPQEIDDLARHRPDDAVGLHDADELRVGRLVEQHPLVRPGGAVDVRGPDAEIGDRLEAGGALQRQRRP